MTLSVVVSIGRETRGIREVINGLSLGGISDFALSWAARDDLKYARNKGRLFLLADFDCNQPVGDRSRFVERAAGFTVILRQGRPSCLSGYLELARGARLVLIGKPADETDAAATVQHSFDAGVGTFLLTAEQAETIPAEARKQITLILDFRRKDLGEVVQIAAACHPQAILVDKGLVCDRPIGDGQKPMSYHLAAKVYLATLASALHPK